MNSTPVWQRLHYTQTTAPQTTEGPVWYWLPGWSFTPDIFAGWYAHLPGTHFGLDYRHLHHPHHSGADAVELSFADTVQRLIEQSQPNAHWIGWSLGGALAASAAAPANAASLTTLATGSPFCQHGDNSWGMPPETLAAFIAGFRTRPAKTQQRFIGLCAQGSPDPKALMRALATHQYSTGPETDRSLLTTLNWLMDYDIPPINASLPARHIYANADAIHPGGLSPATRLEGSHSFWLEEANSQPLLEELMTIHSGNHD